MEKDNHESPQEDKENQEEKQNGSKILKTKTDPEKACCHNPSTPSRSNGLVEACHISSKELVPSGARVWKLVLTGGPCAGKTTAQARLSTFFESIGWRVFRVPEAATVIINGGIKFGVLTPEETLVFQEDLIKLIFQLEDTYFHLAESSRRNCLVICDRGSMDCSAYLPKKDWETILERNNWSEEEIRDNRYNHVIHLVSAARGAPEHYRRDNNTARTEDIEAAIEMDKRTGEAWVGHPYVDIVHNESTDFETKMRRVTRVVTERLAIQAKDWLHKGAVKLKFLVSGPLMEDDKFGTFLDFEVRHNYLPVQIDGGEPRIRRRGRHNKWMYTHTVRSKVKGEVVEVKTNISKSNYESLLAIADSSNVTIIKTRRCFIWESQYYHLDIYKEPQSGLMLLETYTATAPDKLHLPEFLNIEKNVTGEKQYSMYTLSLKQGDRSEATKK